MPLRCLAVIDCDKRNLERHVLQSNNEISRLTPSILKNPPGKVVIGVTGKAVVGIVVPTAG